MVRTSRWLIAVLLAPMLACGGSAEREMSTTIVLNRTGSSVIGARNAAPPFRDSARVPVRVDVRNESGRAATVEDILAVVVDSQGRTQACATLATEQLLEAGAAKTYRRLLSGNGAEDSVLGIAVRFREAGRGPAGNCAPLCLGCDNVKTQRACERFYELMGRGETVLRCP